MVSWQKLSASIGSATTDPQQGEATTQPIPPPIVSNKPAPGRQGPVGLAPRQTYSRVNTGVPPAPDAGTITQKSQRPRGLEFLPAKVAQQENFMTTMMRRPSLLALVKEAMEGTASQVDINTEAMFQQENIGEPTPQEKTASAQTYIPDVVPTDYVEKVAAALDFLSKQAEEGTNKLEPGKGPGALEVLEATSSEENYDVKDSGQAKTQIPMTPPMVSSGVAKDPSNAMGTNIDMEHAEQPVDPMGGEKTSEALYIKNLTRLGLQVKEAAPTASAMKTMAFKPGVASTAKKVLRRAESAVRGAGRYVKGKGEAAGKAISERAKDLPGKAREAGKKGYEFTKKHKRAIGATGAALTVAGVGAGGYAAGKKKKASVSDELLARNLRHLGLYKAAEDAINPAKISAGSTQTGATPPEGASPSEEQVPSEPGDVTSQKTMIGSNQAAIDYTRGKAKANPKGDVNKVLDEPALTSATDKVLQNVFDHTGQAGVKISHIRRDLTKTAAAQALLSKIAKEAEEEKQAKDLSEGQRAARGASSGMGLAGYFGARAGQKAPQRGREALSGKKEKESQMGAGSTPPPLTGASAGQIM